MIRLQSKGINDLDSLKIEYWDNSCLFKKGGYPVKIPTKVDIEWLTTPSEAEKTILVEAMSSEFINDWSIITIPCPNQYPNHSLYFVGHFDNDMIIQDQENVLPLVFRLARKLTDNSRNQPSSED